MIRVFIPAKLVNVTNHGLFSWENQSLNIDHQRVDGDENKPIMDQGKQRSPGMAQRRLENVASVALVFLSEYSTITVQLSEDRKLIFKDYVLWSHQM